MKRMPTSVSVVATVLMLALCIALPRVTFGTEPSPRAPIFKLLDALLLSNKQKDEIAVLLGANRARIETVVSELVRARTKLHGFVHDENASEEKVRQAFREVAKAEEEAQVLRAKIVKKFYPLLNDSQKNFIETKREQMLGQLQTRANAYLAELTKWIARHGSVEQASTRPGSTS